VNNEKNHEFFLSHFSPSHESICEEAKTLGSYFYSLNQDKSETLQAWKALQKKSTQKNL
jgi:hypothetical protein